MPESPPGPDQNTLGGIVSIESIERDEFGNLYLSGRRGTGPSHSIKVVRVGLFSPEKVLS